MTWKELEALLPHIFIASITFVALVSRILDYLKYKQKTVLIIKLVKIDPKIDRDLLKTITQPSSHQLTDLKKGLLLITLGVACLIFAQNMIDPEYKNAMRGLAAFPGLMGLIYVIFYYLPKNNINSKEDH